MSTSRHPWSLLILLLVLAALSLGVEDPPAALLDHLRRDGLNQG